jgi:enamine deaminase RidA (YjgF/YER057c/UK114 family)
VASDRSAIERINPPSLIPPQGMSHVVATRGGTTLHVAGQGAYTGDYQLVGAGDVGAQAAQCFRNVLTALAAAGATWRDVVKATFYVVGVTPETLQAFVGAMHEVLGDDADPPPASTFVGVASLAFPEMLVEIEVTAVI